MAIPDENGLDATMRTVAEVKNARPALPRLVHVENNPQKPAGNGGAAFMDASRASQESYLRDFADAQARHAYEYMLPVFFPLSSPGDGQHAFDAKAHDLLAFERGLAK